MTELAIRFYCEKTAAKTGQTVAEREEQYTRRVITCFSGTTQASREEIASAIAYRAACGFDEVQP